MHHSSSAETSSSLNCECVFTFDTDLAIRPFRFPRQRRGPHSALALEEALTQTQVEVYVCAQASARVRPHLSFYVLQCPPLNTERGFTHTHTHP